MQTVKPLKHSGLQKEVLSVYRQLLKSASRFAAKTPIGASDDLLQKKLNVYASIRKEFRENQRMPVPHGIEHLVRKAKKALMVFDDPGFEGISGPKGLLGRSYPFRNKRS
ncbi:hypothetical protein HDU83_003793 [Entophlyctis luteolus]|nr:hypothetical protein HDU82_008343 [Entophlyctis luteolus]KAJ3355216.1 hypothetical protein HDU83_003793 [Entophlyctis luteolus]KAJ3391868.1 hypothetical protein HDU84_005219 [Entophlyctis sp. JEL0112]